MPKIFINSGHSSADPGFICGCGTESSWNMKIRDELRSLVPEAYFVPDNLNLRQTLDWINEYADKDSLAIDIHLNSSNNVSLRGTEVYYAEMYRYADIFSKNVSEHLGVFNRGVKHDSLSYVGSLAFLRQLKCPSVLIEACYLTNEEDKKVLQNDGPKKIAEGIKKSLDILFKDPIIIETLQKQQLNLIQQVLSALKEKILLLLKKYN